MGSEEQPRAGMWRKPRDIGPSTWFHYSPTVARVICGSSAFWAISGLCACCLGTREGKWSQTNPQIPSQISWFGSLETAIFIGPKLSTVNCFMKFNQKYDSDSVSEVVRMEGDLVGLKLDQWVEARNHILRPLNSLSQSHGDFVPNSVWVTSWMRECQHHLFIAFHAQIIWRERKRPLKLEWLSRQS